MRSRSKHAIALAVAGIALSGCGVAGTGDTSSDASSSPAHDKMLEYAQCLRENGLDVEDPEPGEGVELRGQQDKIEPALQACEDLEPPGQAKEPEGAREDMLRIARCMREHGVEDFPDPKPGEGITIDGKIAEEPDFENARKACDPKMPAPGKGERP